MEPGWDKTEYATLKVLGLNHQQAMIAVGRIAEHRQRAYLQGFSRGYENGVNKHPETQKATQPLMHRRC